MESGGDFFQWLNVLSALDSSMEAYVVSILGLGFSYICKQVAAPCIYTLSQLATSVIASWYQLNYQIYLCSLKA